MILTTKPVQYTLACTYDELHDIYDALIQAETAAYERDDRGSAEKFYLLGQYLGERL